MKLLVIGLGSMGRRRIRLIKQFDKSITIVGIDLNNERRRNVTHEFNIETKETIEEAIISDSFDCAFICTSPLSHSKLISTCLHLGLHVFTELNLVSDGYEENTALAASKNKVLFLSSTFLYRAEIMKIDELVKQHDKKLNYTYHVGQYLPDWHPWENYMDFFVGDKRTNGCREIFAIELPWITKVFGPIRELVVRKDKISTLNIDYADNYLVLIEHESGHKGMLAVDVVSRKAVRNLEIMGEDLHVSWDGSSEGLQVFDIEQKINVSIRLYDYIDQLESYSRFIIENAYSSEIEAFFKAVSNSIQPKYTFEEDKRILDIIDRIEA